MRFQGKPGSLQLSYGEKGRRVRDTRLLRVENPTVKIQINPQKRDFQEQIQARTVREMQGREGAAPCEHTQHSTPNIPASIPHTPGTFTSTHPQLHSPPTMQKKQGPALQREKKIQEQLREEKKDRNRREGTSKGSQAKIRDKNLG